jgi:hypothetical protein
MALLLSLPLGATIRGLGFLRRAVSGQVVATREWGHGGTCDLQLQGNRGDRAELTVDLLVCGQVRPGSWVTKQPWSRSLGVGDHTVVAINAVSLVASGVAVIVLSGAIAFILAFSFLPELVERTLRRRFARLKHPPP